MTTGKDVDSSLVEAGSTVEMAEALRASGAVDDLLAQIDTGEVALTGEGGLLPGLIKLALERGLAAELTDHLGYEKGDSIGRAMPNARNGSSPKTVQSEAGPVSLDVPRDRDGSFTPTLVPKGARRIGGLDDMIISLYAGGMTLRDIQFHLASTIGTEVSHETISKIVDEISDEVLAWQRRPLEPLYPVIYLDAMIVKVKDGGHTRNKAAHIAVGVDMDGVKHVLGIWVQPNEGASFWASVCSDLANRGIKDVLIVCCDGLTGFPEAIAATWSQAAVQTCVVHLIRNALRFVSYSDRKAVAAALKPIYTAPSADAARAESQGVHRLGVGQEEPHGDKGFRTGLGAVHPIPGVPARVTAGDLHDQLDRVAELPDAQGHQEPRPVPQRRLGRETCSGWQSATSRTNAPPSGPRNAARNSAEPPPDDS